jgi:hypothetical protein
LQAGKFAVALSGWNPITIADGINGSLWAFGVWLEDGTIVFNEMTGLRRVSSDGGETTELTTVDTSSGETLHRFVDLVPSTPAVLLTVFAAPSTRIEAVQLETGERHVVVDSLGGEAGRESMMAVSVEVSATPDGPSLELGKPVVLFDLHVSGPNGELEVYDIGNNVGTGYDVLPDGRFVMARDPDQSTSREIVLVRNWLNELERAAPTK